MGQTITYNWTLPTTFSISQVNLFVYIADGAPNNPATHTCSVGSTTALGVTSTSGTLTIPANMSACGLSALDTIKQVSVFLEVGGVNGEDTIDDFSFPY